MSAPPRRSSDVIEMIAEKSIYFFVVGLLLLGAGFVFWYWQGAGTFNSLAYVLLIIGGILVVIGGVSLLKLRKVSFNKIVCPYCGAVNELTEAPTEDFDCVSCSRMIPVQDGKIMKVSQVRCGFCGALNYYSDKSEVLICEECDHEIPIAQDDEGNPTKVIPKAFRVTDDDSLYELVLTEAGKNTEETIAALQQMLALNRSQVKDILESLPATLLTGINRRKAEMLQAQLSVHGAAADITAMNL